MIVTNSSAFSPESPTIDVSEARWASEELALLIARIAKVRYADRLVAGYVQLFQGTPLLMR